MIVRVEPSKAEELWMARGQYERCQDYTCHECEASCSYERLPFCPSSEYPINHHYKGVFADTEGEPFKAYLCRECAERKIDHDQTRKIRN